jgi:hypothetical protein
LHQTQARQRNGLKKIFGCRSRIRLGFGRKKLNSARKKQVVRRYSLLVAHKGLRLYERVVSLA